MCRKSSALKPQHITSNQNIRKLVTADTMTALSTDKELQVRADTMDRNKSYQKDSRPPAALHVATPKEPSHFGKMEPSFYPVWLLWWLHLRWSSVYLFILITIDLLLTGDGVTLVLEKRMNICCKVQRNVEHQTEIMTMFDIFNE